MFGLRRLPWTLVLLLAATAAYAGPAQLTAHMSGTTIDPDAHGRAIWTVDRRNTVLTVMAANVSVTDMAAVVVDGQLVASMEIVNGEGLLQLRLNEAEGDRLRVKPGSSIALYDARTLSDIQAPFLFGSFRAQ